MSVEAIRAEVMAQPEAERLAYALDLIAWYLDPLPEWWQGAAALGLDLAPADLRMLHALDRRRGLYLTHDALLSARAPGEEDPEALASHHELSRGIGRIRRALEGQPATITNWPGIGYRLDAPVTWRIERGGS